MCGPVGFLDTMFHEPPAGAGAGADSGGGAGADSGGGAGAY